MSKTGFEITIFRAIYDGDGEGPDKFLERIDARIKNHDKEIERMCNYHYQGFIESIRGLLQVRSDVEKLKVYHLLIYFQKIILPQLAIVILNNVPYILALY